MDDSQSPPVMGDCGIKETSLNRFWCKCFDLEDPTNHVWPDDCLCRSGWRWSPTEEQADPQCSKQDCTYTCFTVDDDDIPSWPDLIQNCDCHQ